MVLISVANLGIKTSTAILGVSQNFGSYIAYVSKTLNWPSILLKDTVL